MITAAELLTYINEKTPEITNDPDRIRAAWKRQEVMSAVKEALDTYNAETDALIQRCIDAGAVSDMYVIASPVRRFTTVDVKKAEETMSREAFMDIVHLHPSDAVRLITPSVLFDLILDTVDYDAIRPYLRINKEDLIKAVPSGAVSEYLKEHSIVSPEKHVYLRPELDGGKIA